MIAKRSAHCAELSQPDKHDSKLEKNLGVAPQQTFIHMLRTALARVSTAAHSPAMTRAHKRVDTLARAESRFDDGHQRVWLFGPGQFTSCAWR